MSRLRFGPFTLDQSRRRLLNGDALVALAPRPFDVLVCLAERAGRLVTREEILTEIWGGADVPDNALTVAVSKARAALGAVGRGYIETVSGFGYRFVAAVRPDGPLSMAAVEAVGLGTVRALGPEAEPLASGMAAAIADALAGLDVPVDSSAPATLAADLDVARDRAVLSVRIETDERTLWARALPTVFEDPAEGRRTLAAAAAEVVAGRLAASARARAAGSPGSSPPPTYYAARYIAERRIMARTREALAGFEAAVEADPAFAPAWAGLAQVAVLLPTGAGVPAREAFPRARLAAERALDLAPEDPTPLVTLAHVAWRYDWDVSEAERLVCEALSRSGGLDARGLLAALFAHTNRVDEAIALGRDAPTGPEAVPFHLDLSMATSLARRPEAAFRHLDAVKAHAPDLPIAHLFMAHACDAQGDAEGAVEEAERAVQAAGPHVVFLGALAGFLGLAGRRDEALAVLAEAERRPEAAVFPSMLAQAPASLGDAITAVAALRRAVDIRDPLLIHLPTWSCLDPIRDDPAFRAVVWSTGLS